MIGLGYSADGNHWYRYGSGPVLGLGVPRDWDSDFVGNGTIIKESTGLWHMWFSGGQTMLGTRASATPPPSTASPDQVGQQIPS